MAFNNLYSAEKHFLMNPKDLGFTQADIKSTFTDPTYPSVRETASLLRLGLLSPNVLGPLHVCIDEHGNMWSDNNRRLFALRDAGVDSVPVVFYGPRRPINSLKSKLSDPAFMPRIRGEARGRVRIPPPPNSVQNVYQLEDEPEPSVSAGYSNSSHEDEDELGVRLSHLAISSAFTRREWGEVNPDDSFSAPRRSEVRITQQNDSVFMPNILGFNGSRLQIPPQPTSGENANQMANKASVLDSDSSGYSNRQYHSVHYDYSYEEDGTLKDEGEVEYCLSSLFFEAQDEVEYCHLPYPEDYDNDSDLFW